MSRGLAGLRVGLLERRHPAGHQGAPAAAIAGEIARVAAGRGAA